MSTSRKLRLTLAKHRHSARKAARKEPEPEPAESSTAETQASGNSHRPLCAHRYSICLLLPLAVLPQIICRTQFVHLHISEPTPGPSGHRDRDKMYKVRPMLDRMLPLFRHYYSPSQQLSLDEGMIPIKNRLAIKQYIRDKPVRWGIKSFLLCEGKTGYILDAEIYTGRVRDRHRPRLGSAGSVVRRLVENSQVTNKNHMLFMENSVSLFDMLKNELGVLAAGTVMPSRKHYPKELGRRLTERGRYKFRCRGALCAIAWKDRKPIHFLSNYHDPRRASTVNRRVGDRLAQLTVPQLVVDYTR